MKRDKTKTTGYVLSVIIIGLLTFFSFLYFRWYVCDRHKEINNRQTQEMIDYHRSEGRKIQVFE